jgi:hypothetical protein
MKDLAPLLREIFREPDAFAILDAARDERIFPALLAADCDWLCLYRGDAAVRMAEVAPYLVALHPASTFLAWALGEGWGNSWGVFFNAPLPLGRQAHLERLQAHFRRFLMAQLPNGHSVYFRFYDPRVLRAYLPTCSEEERRTFFGPVERFVMEDKNGAPASFEV